MRDDAHPEKIEYGVRRRGKSMIDWSITKETLERMALHGEDVYLCAPNIRSKPMVRIDRHPSISGRPTYGAWARFLGGGPGLDFAETLGEAYLRGQIAEATNPGATPARAENVAKLQKTIDEEGWSGLIILVREEDRPRVEALMDLTQSTAEGAINLAITYFLLTAGVHRDENGAITLTHERDVPPNLVIFDNPGAPEDS